MTELPAVLAWGLKATPLLLAAWAVTTLLRRASASTRHYVWALALGAALVLPLVAAVAPRLELPLPGLAPRPRAPIAAPVIRERDASAGGAVAAWDATVRAPAAAAGVAVVIADAPAASALSAASVVTRFWAAGAGLVLVLVALSLWRTGALARRARPLAHLGVAREARELARRLGVRRDVMLLQATGDDMPMTWGALRPRVLVPVSFVAWPAARRQAVLLHELAHVKRWDWVTQLGARVACALYWWNPLAWVAARRLREERELACDDLVLVHGPAASAYAGDLLEIARRFRAAPASALGGVAMARRSQLANRLLAVLDAARPRRSLEPRRAVPAATVALAALVPVAGLTGVRAPGPEPEEAPVTVTWSAPDEPAPVPPVRSSVRPPVQSRSALLCDWAAPSGSNSSSTSVNDDAMMIQLARDGCTMTVRAEGELTYTDDDRDIARLARGGFFEIEERTGRSRRRVEIADGSGGMERRWFVDGSERPYGEEARAWLGDALLVLVRRAGINAEARAARILEAQGVDGLIAEIALLQNDHVAGRYYRVLFERGELTSAQLVRLLDDAASRIESDYELGRVLGTVAARRPADAQVHQAYVRATAGIESDHEQARALGALADAVDLEAGALDAMLSSALRIDSDFERGRLLLTVAERYPAGRALPAAYLAAVADMGSDHERGRVLGRLLERDRLAPAERARVLEVVRRLGSDHTQAQLLVAVAAGGPLDETTRGPFFAAVDRIGSDHSRQQVLQAVAEAGPDAATTLALLESARAIGSDHAKGQVLIAVAARGLGDERVRAAYLSVAGSIGSRSERDRVLRAAGLQGA